MSQTTESTTETKKQRSELAKLTTKLQSLKKRRAQLLLPPKERIAKLDDEIANVKQRISDELDSDELDYGE